MSVCLVSGHSTNATRKPWSYTDTLLEFPTGAESSSALYLGGLYRLARSVSDAAVCDQQQGTRVAA
jgi:hypothetical protein